MRILLLALSFSATAAFAKNVGFPDIDFFVKTKLIDGPKADVYSMEFWWCQVGRDDLDKRECVALSSCRYGNEELVAEVKKLPAGEMKDELELAVTSSYQTKLKAAKYLPELLKLLKAASAKKECVLAERVEVKDAKHATLSFEYPPLKHGR